MKNREIQHRTHFLKRKNKAMRVVMVIWHADDVSFNYDIQLFQATCVLLAMTEGQLWVHEKYQKVYWTYDTENGTRG